MPIDRGGLEYPIRVEDEFSDNLSKFQKDLAAATQSFLSFKATLATGANFNLGGAGGGGGGGISQIVNDLRNISIGSNNVDNSFKSLRQSLLLINQDFSRTSISIRGFTNALREIGSGATDVDRVMRRLLDTLLVVRGVRFAVNIFTSILSDSLEFNKTLETSRLGIATLFTAVGHVSDATGTTVKGAQALSLSLTEAGRQTQLLRRDALQTSNTFEELVKAFQVALAPGLQAGLNVDQVRKFTVQISQAATAIGLADNQLSEEIRSILGATISQRNTRIANALGITNEDIVRAKQAGTLAEFLQGKFSAFAVASQAALGTFTSLLSRTRDALVQITATGALPFFESLKKLMGDVFKLATVKTPEGIFAPNPEAVTVVQNLAEGLRAMSEEARRLFATLSLKDVADAARVAGQTIAFVFQAIGAVLVGVLRGINDLSKLVEFLGVQFGNLKLFEGIGPALQELISGFTEILIVVGGILIGVKAVGAALLLLNGPLGAIALLAAAITFGIDQWGESTKDANLSLTETASILKVQLLTSLKEVRLELAKFALQAAKGFLGVFATEDNEVIKNLTGALKDIEFEFEKLKTEATKGFDAARNGADGAASSTNRARVQAEGLSKTFDGLPAIIGQSGTGLENVKNLSADLSKDLAKARNDLETGLQGIGLTGAIVQEQKAATEEIAKFAEKTKILGAEQAQNQAAINGLKAKQIQFEAEIAAFAPALRNETLLAIKGGEEQLRLTRQQASAAADVAEAEITLDGLRSAGSKNEIAGAERTLALRKEALAVVTKTLTDQKRSNDELLKNSGDAQVTKARNLVTGTITANGQLLDQERRKTELLQTSTDLRSKEGAVASAQIQLIATKENDALTKSNVLLNQKREHEERLNKAQASFEPFAVQNEQLRNEKETLALQRNQAAVDGARAEAAIREQIAQAQARVDNLRPAEGVTGEKVSPELENALQAQIALQKQLNLTKEQTFQKDLAIEAQLEQVRKKQQQLRDEAADPITTGLEIALHNLQAQAEQAATQFAGIVTGLVKGFSDFAANAIVDAFDPTKKVDLKERFAAFLRDLSRQIISFLIQIAVTKLILKVASLAAGDAGGEIASAASGGKVPDHGQASLAHYGFGKQGRFIHGYALGGPPAGVPRSDTVPAWLTPGEWVIKKKSVARYGQQVMHAINEGLVDPLGLRALAGGAALSSASRRSVSGPGYAAGGLIPDAVANQARASQASQEANSGVVRATLVANEQAMERLAAGGRNALLNFISDNAGGINQRLGQRGRP